MTDVVFIDHNETDVLLWMTAPAPRGPFDSTAKLWAHCIDRLVKRGYVERTGDALDAVTVTPKGDARAAELRERDAFTTRKENER